MARDIALRLTATDSVTPALTKIGSVATQADGQLKAFDSSLNKAGTTAERFSKVGASVGAVIGAMTGILADAARASAEAEVSQQRLEASIEATGHMYEEYADQVKRAGDAAVQMSFDDEDAADAISFLTQATGDASTAINDLGLVMDIARARGIDLAAAAKIVAAAEQERFGQLARIGIQLDENATKEEAIAALQQKYAGQAVAYAETNIGFLDRLKVKYENVMEALGDYTGGVSQLLVLLPGLSAGFTAAAAAAGAFGLTLGPVGIAVAAGLAAFGIYKLIESTDGMVSSAEVANQKLGDLEQTIRELYAAGNTLGTLGERGAEGIFPDLSADVARIEEIENAIAQTNRAIGSMGEEDAAKAQANLERWSFELIGLADKYGILDAQMLASTITQQDVIAGMEDLNAILSFTGAGAAQAQLETAELFDQWSSEGHGGLSAKQFLSDLDLIANSFDSYNELATKGAESTGQLADAQGALSAATQAIVAVNDDYIGSIYTTNLAHQQAAIYTAKLATAQKDLETQFAQTRQAYTSAADAAESVFRTAVGNTSAIAQQSQATADWADELIGVQGEYSKLDDLVSAKKITGTSGVFDDGSQYAAAQQAYNSILSDNAEIQENILAIQAMQAPVIAQAQSNLADYTAELQGASAEEQMFALAMMDSQTASQALGLAQAYIADQDTFGPMIEEAARLNPYLATILEQMGLISYNEATGTVTLLGVDEARSELDMLQSAINALVMAEWIAMFDGDPSAAEAAYEQVMGDATAWDNLEASATLSVQDNASGTLSTVQSLIDAIDGRSATSYVTTYYTDYYSQVLDFLGGGQRSDGGTIPRMANGGIPVVGAEHGMELVKRASGGSMLMTTPGVYNLSPGDQVFHAGATRTMLGAGGLTVNINIDGAGAMGDQQARELAQLIVPALVRALEQAETEMVA